MFPKQTLHATLNEALFTPKNVETEQTYLATDPFYAVLVLGHMVTTPHMTSFRVACAFRGQLSGFDDMYAAMPMKVYDATAIVASFPTFDDPRHGLAGKWQFNDQGYITLVDIPPTPAWIDAFCNRNPRWACAPPAAVEEVRQLKTKSAL